MFGVDENLLIAIGFIKSAEHCIAGQHELKHKIHTQFGFSYIWKVDKHIRRLDSDLARFEAELKEQPSIVSKLKSPKDSKLSKDKQPKEKIGLAWSYVSWLNF